MKWNLHESLRSDHGVCRADQDTEGGRSRPPSAVPAHGGGDAVFDGTPPHPVLQTGQHRGAVAAAFQHWLHREKVKMELCGNLAVCVWTQEPNSGGSAVTHFHYLFNEGFTEETWAEDNKHPKSWTNFIETSHNADIQNFSQNIYPIFKKNVEF